MKSREPESLRDFNVSVKNLIYDEKVVTHIICVGAAYKKQFSD